MSYEKSYFEDLQSLKDIYFEIKEKKDQGMIIDDHWENEVQQETLYSKLRVELNFVLSKFYKTIHETERK
jgi:hypothetical protein